MAAGIVVQREGLNFVFECWVMCGAVGLDQCPLAVFGAVKISRARELCSLPRHDEYTL